MNLVASREHNSFVKFRNLKFEGTPNLELWTCKLRYLPDTPRNARPKFNTLLRYTWVSTSLPVSVLLEVETAWTVRNIGRYNIWAPSKVFSG